MLTHQTRYRYDRPVRLGPQTIRLRPSPTAVTPVRSYALRVEPAECKQTWQRDSFGNHVAKVIFSEPVTYFDITVRLEADLTPRDPFDFTLAPAARCWAPPAGLFSLLQNNTRHSALLPDGPQQGMSAQVMVQQDAAAPRVHPAPGASRLSETNRFYTPDDLADLALYRAAPPAGPHLHMFLAEWVAKAPEETLEMLVALNRALAARVKYQVRLEPGVWSPEETLARGAGSCRDSAWLMIALLRYLGFAARFVSGYLIQSCQTAEGEDTLTCDLHAWAEVFLPGAGWVGFDTTSGLLAAQGHLPLAATPTPEQAAPVAGLLDRCQATFDVSMQMDRLVIPDVA